MIFSAVVFALGIAGVLIYIFYSRIKADSDDKKFAGAASKKPQLLITRKAFIEKFSSRQRLYLWEDVKNVVWKEGAQRIVITFNNSKSISVSDRSHYNFTLFFMALPQYLKVDDAIQQEHNRRFSNLKPCQICNYQAVSRDLCAVCYNEPFEHLSQSEKSAYKSKKKYIAQMRSEWNRDDSRNSSDIIVPFKKTR
jgi:hypothetical protein